MAPGEVGVGMIGLGTVGGGVARLLCDHCDLYRRRIGRSIRLRRVLVRDAGKQRVDGRMGRDLVTTDADAFFATADMPIIVEVAGGSGPVAAFVQRALSQGKHVVTANKSLLAEQGCQLFALARENNVSIAFEASCGGGIPIVTALQFGLMANRIDALYGILNGTSNFILTGMTHHGQTYADALRRAQEKGFAEADPTLDVSGRDAAQKLAILAGIAFGGRVESMPQVCEGIDTLDLADIRFGAELGYDIKLLAMGQRVTGPTGGGVSLRTGPCFVRKDSPLALVRGSSNALLVHGHAVGQTMYYGPGAGAMPTASAVVSDLLNVAAGWYPKAFGNMNLWAGGHDLTAVSSAEDPASRFYLRINARDTHGVMARVSAILGQERISLSAILQHEPAEGDFVPLVILTHRAGEGSIRRALAAIEQLDVIDGRPVSIRIVDLPGA